MFSANDLVLIRHAAAATGGRLCGRTDVGLDAGTDSALQELAGHLPDVADLRVSPAVRCRLTAAALWPAARQTEDHRLWEQDFGAWEGVAYTELPDLGMMSQQDLASNRPPGGESFLDVLKRTTPVLDAAAEEARGGTPVVIVAHAGVVRAGLSLALGVPSAGLGFEIAPLSVTRIRCFDGGFAIASVNWRPA